MKNQDWRGLMKILEVFEYEPSGQILWYRKNLLNTLHVDGEEFMLLALFTGGPTNAIIPTNYYLGLDNRATVSTTDDFTTLSNEPTSNGYARQSLSSTGDFTVTTDGNGNYQADTAVVTFRANGGDWGPVSNLFLCTSLDNSGYLIASAPLSASTTVSAGNTISLRLGLSLKDC